MLITSNLLSRRRTRMVVGNALILYKVNGQSMSCYFETPFSRTPFGVSRAAENYEYTCLITVKQTILKIKSLSSIGSMNGRDLISK